MSNLLEVQDLSVAYGKVEAVRGVSLSIAVGSIVTVIGPNGAGKTTLLNAILGLLPRRGTVRYLDRQIRGNEVEAVVSAGLCLVPEQRELFLEMSVADNLLLGSYVRRNLPSHARANDLKAVYTRFPRLKERSGQMAGNLSGGERQMLAIARALMSRPKLLMLDEPSLGLAPLIIREMFEIIKALRESGVSILLVEQNARAALQAADYGYVLETGSVVLEGSAAELGNNPNVAATYLGLSEKKMSA